MTSKTGSGAEDAGHHAELPDKTVVGCHARRSYAITHTSNSSNYKLCSMAVIYCSSRRGPSFGPSSGSQICPFNATAPTPVCKCYILANTP